MKEPAASYRVVGKKVYRGFSQAELNRQYDARSTAPDGQTFRDYLAGESARVRDAYDCREDVAYGPGPAEAMDIFPARAPGSPVVIFIHGGYWRSSSRKDLDLFAETFVPAGAAYVSIDYALAPAVSIDEIVRQCRTALAWCWKHAAEYNGDPDRLFINGRSAGGHLVGMLLAAGWREELGLPADLIKGATAVSGLFDLEPVRLSSVNNWAQLDRDAAWRNSPVHHLPPVGCPLILAWGGEETAEFKRQSDLYALAWRSRGYPCTTLELAGKHHFATMPDLRDRNSPLTQAVFRQMGLL